MANDQIAVNNAPQTQMQRFNAAIRGTNAQAYLTTLLGEKKDQFVQSLVSVVASNDLLQKCDPMSLVYTAVKATAVSLSIDPSIGEAAVIPYGRNASFQIMRNGWMSLLLRTGEVKFVANEVVHEGELVKKNKFTGEYVFDEDAKKSDKVIGYMASLTLLNGYQKTVYWTVEEVKAHALRYSQTYRSGKGVWHDLFDQMALKTVLKQLITKYAPKSAEILKARDLDQIVTNQDNVSTFADNPQNGNVDEQAQPEQTETAKAKAEEVKAKMEAMKARRAKQTESPAPEKEEAPAPTIEDMPADIMADEIFNQD